MKFNFWSKNPSPAYHPGDLVEYGINVRGAGWQAICYARVTSPPTIPYIDGKDVYVRFIDDCMPQSFVNARSLKPAKPEHAEQIIIQEYVTRAGTLEGELAQLQAKLEGLEPGFRLPMQENLFFHAQLQAKLEGLEQEKLNLPAKFRRDIEFLYNKN
ncbi:MAG: hypothetical protein HY364_04115 [Candidatus Aenigmarchaeota archaeon]|nr:hypothetical protein [Candidatus Aenigmarchaeota archaeon]